MSLSPLAGVRVLEVTLYVSGPSCARLLADYGADVTKVERPSGGDPARHIPPFYRDEPHPDGSAHGPVSKRLGTCSNGLEAANITAGPVQDEEMAYACPHLESRGFFQPLTSPHAGTHVYPGINVKFEETPNRLRRHPVQLGEDNEYVYRELLGMDDDEYRKLYDLGHIGTDYAADARSR